MNIACIYVYICIYPITNPIQIPVSTRIRQDKIFLPRPKTTMKGKSYQHDRGNPIEVCPNATCVLFAWDGWLHHEIQFGKKKGEAEKHLARKESWTFQSKSPENTGSCFWQHMLHIACTIEYCSPEVSEPFPVFPKTARITFSN